MNINKNEDHDMNRGIELMFRERKNQVQPKEGNEKGLTIKKSISFFGRELLFHFQVIMKRNN
jgi:hypothetical protein